MNSLIEEFAVLNSRLICGCQDIRSELYLSTLKAALFFEKL